MTECYKIPCINLIYIVVLVRVFFFNFLVNVICFVIAGMRAKKYSFRIGQKLCCKEDTCITIVKIFPFSYHEFAIHIIWYLTEFFISIFNLEMNRMMNLCYTLYNKNFFFFFG